MHIVITVLAGVAGAVIGSFLNVVALRLHGGKQFITGHSECPKCHRPLGALELIPVLSWLVLRGRCHHCGKPISPQYPLVELATATLFVIAYLSQPHHAPWDIVVLALWLYIIASFIVLTIYDLRWYLLPDRVLLPIIAPAMAINLGEAIRHHSAVLFTHPLAAAVFFGGGFYLLAAVSKGKWMGGGDVKLAFIIGLLLGFQKSILAMFVGFDSAAIIGVALILAHRKKRTDMIPFGPFLMAGTLVAFFWGSAIIRWYLHATIF